MDIPPAPDPLLPQLARVAMCIRVHRWNQEWNVPRPSFVRVSPRRPSGNKPSKEFRKLDFVYTWNVVLRTVACQNRRSKGNFEDIYIYIHVSNIFLFIVRGEKFPFEFYFREKYLEKSSNVSVELHCTLLCTILGRIEGVDRVKIALFFQPSRIDRLNRSSRAYDVKFENWANRRRKGDTGRAVELGSFHSLILNTLNFEDEHRSSERSFSRMFRPTFLSLYLSRNLRRSTASSVVIVVIANNYSTQQADASSFRIKLGLNIPSITRRRFTVGNERAWFHSKF